ncbi:MAG: hypothetical protein ACR2J8_12430 [Thermomicrobiales bacterium]
MSLANVGPATVDLDPAARFAVADRLYSGDWFVTPDNPSVDFNSLAIAALAKRGAVKTEA